MKAICVIACLLASTLRAQHNERKDVEKNDVAEKKNEEDALDTMFAKNVHRKGDEGWIDPFDTFTSNKETPSVTLLIDEEKAVKLKEDDSYLLRPSNTKISIREDERFYRKLIQHFLVSSKDPKSTDKVKLIFSVDKSTELTWKEFLNSNKPWDVDSLHESVIKCLHTDAIEASCHHYLIELSNLSYVTYYFAIIAAIGICCFMVVVYIIPVLWRTTFSLRVLFILILSISVPWEWMRMYRVALAEKMATIELEYPKECFPGKITIFNSLTSWFSSQLYFQRDKCLKYHEQLLVDPFLKVSPIKAVAVALSSIFIEPMTYFADTAGKSYKIFFAEIPILWQPIIFFGTVIFFLAFAIFIRGFKISTLFGGFEVNGDDNNGAINMPITQPIHSAIQPRQNNNSLLMQPIQDEIQAQQIVENVTQTEAIEELIVPRIKEEETFESISQRLVVLMENDTKLSRDDITNFLKQLKVLLNPKGIILEISNFNRASTASIPKEHSDATENDDNSTFVFLHRN